MADSKTRRLRPADLQADLDAYAALQTISGYAPTNPKFGLDEAEDKLNLMRSGQSSETQAEAAAKAARDTAVAAEWAFHDLMLGVKNQIKAQFGDSSNELQAVGLKKKTEYKSKARKTNPPTP